MQLSRSSCKESKLPRRISSWISAPWLVLKLHGSSGAGFAFAVPSYRHLNFAHGFASLLLPDATIAEAFTFAPASKIYIQAPWTHIYMPYAFLWIHAMYGGTCCSMLLTHSAQSACGNTCRRRGSPRRASHGRAPHKPPRAVQEHPSR